MCDKVWDKAWALRALTNKEDGLIGAKGKNKIEWESVYPLQFYFAPIVKKKKYNFTYLFFSMNYKWIASQIFCHYKLQTKHKRGYSVNIKYPISVSHPPKMWALLDVLAQAKFFICHLCISL